MGGGSYLHILLEGPGIGLLGSCEALNRATRQKVNRGTIILGYFWQMEIKDPPRPFMI